MFQHEKEVSKTTASQVVKTQGTTRSGMPGLDVKGVSWASGTFGTKSIHMHTLKKKKHEPFHDIIVEQIVATSGGSAVGGIGGGVAGSAVGPVMGSAVPVVGTAIGGVVGGLLGGIFGVSVAIGLEVLQLETLQLPKDSAERPNIPNAKHLFTTLFCVTNI